MAITLTSSGIVVEGKNMPERMLLFLDSLLRGIGQVMFQNNSYTGIIFLCGIFYSSTLFGFAALLGTFFSTLTAHILRANKSQIQDGLFGFNGTLTAMGLINFLEPSMITWLYIALAAITSTILMSATLRIFKSLNIPTLTAPFVFTTLGFLLASSHFSQLRTNQNLPIAGFPKSIPSDGLIAAENIWEGLIHGVPQVFFQQNIISGLLFLLGLLVSTRSSCAMALIGSLVGFMSAWLLGANATMLGAGIFGFNSVLTAIALGSVFFKPGAGSFILSLFGSVVTTIVFSAFSSVFAPIGMPAMTLPFVVVTWVFLLAKDHLPSIKRR